MCIWEEDWFWKEVVEFIIRLIEKGLKRKDAIEKAAECMGVSAQVIMNILGNVGF